jgi:hypothetical protein
MKYRKHSEKTIELYDVQGQFLISLLIVILILLLRVKMHQRLRDA